MMRPGQISVTTNVEHVLRSAGDRRETGALVFAGEAPGSVYLLDGLVYCATTEGETAFDDALVHRGLLTREQLAHVRREVAFGKDLAFLFAAEPGVDARGVVQLVHDRSVEALGRLLRAESGSYLLDPYGQHPDGVLGQWDMGSMLTLAIRRYGRPEPQVAVAG